VGASSCGAGAVADPGALPPAYYAARRPGAAQWWTVLHPPYTAWHLGYVVLGASLAPRVTLVPLLATLGAFALAVGVAAHALDELHGRPLRTTIPSGQLLTAAGLGLGGAGALGVLGILRVGPALVPFLVLGPLLVVGYNVELAGGLLHSDAVFALAWGAFPVLTAFVAQTGTLSLGAVLTAAAACALSAAQRQLSTHARTLRRRVVSVEGRLVLEGGSELRLDHGLLLRAPERALAALSWSVVLLATGLAVARMG
jgi:hypothetical protein